MISTESYKGVRDFYPEDEAVQKYIFGVMRKAVESWGYVEYNASVLEPLELYKSKTSEEIVNEQIYSFKDRGDREVVLRPEMTPTVARMVAGRIQELPVPIRWYSIPNVFRYEKPQRGRLREHWQLNVDIFGVADSLSDAEAVSVAYEIMKGFGASPDSFEIKINSRALWDEVFKNLGIDQDDKPLVYRLIDKKEKMDADTFGHSLKSLIGEEKSKALLEKLYLGEALLVEMRESSPARGLDDVIKMLKDRGVNNITFSPGITRGFDYYTGMVFEVFDTNKENPRALFGGGRYDNLVGSFGKGDLPVVGFAVGDVTIRDFLEVHQLLPKLRPATQLYITVAPETDMEAVYRLADSLRSEGVNVAVDISGKKLGDQLKSLDRRQIPFVMTVGAEELKNGVYTLRNSETREEKTGGISDIVGHIKN